MMIIHVSENDTKHGNRLTIAISTGVVLFVIVITLCSVIVCCIKHKRRPTDDMLHTAIYTGSQVSIELNDVVNPLSLDEEVSNV